jgi:Mg-chelatase subunit ChlD
MKKTSRTRAPKFTTEIIVLLDRSGSMATIQNDMVHGFATFVAAQRAVPGRCLLTLTQFDSQGIDTVYEATPVADVPALVLDPRGSTPLLDAMGRTVTRAAERLGKLPKSRRPDRVLFLVVTDGEENASHEFTRDQIKKLVAQREREDGWAFSFLGANVDAFAEAGGLGMSGHGAMNYVADRQGVDLAFLDLSVAASAYRQGAPYRLAPSDPRAQKEEKDK